MKDLYQDVKRNKYGYYELSGIIGASCIIQV